MDKPLEYPVWITHSEGGWFYELPDGYVDGPFFTRNEAEGQAAIQLKEDHPNHKWVSPEHRDIN